MSLFTSDNSPTFGIVYIIDDDEATNYVVSEITRAFSLAVQWHTTAESFFTQYDPHRPSCVILEVHALITCGLDVDGRVHSHNWPPIIFITSDTKIPVVFEALVSSTSRLIPKPLNQDLLSKHIQEAIALDCSKREELALANDIIERVGTLTKRENEIMRLLANGESTKQIAHSLGISPKTAENHRAKILEKMRADNPTQIACMLTRVDEHRRRQN